MPAAQHLNPNVDLDESLLPERTRPRINIASRTSKNSFVTVSLPKRTCGETALRPKNRAMSRMEKPFLRGIAAKRRLSPHLSVLEIVAGNQIGYSDAQNQRSYWECWIK